MSKILAFNLEAKEKLLAGIKILADAVGATLGPLGDNVAIDKKWGSPSIVHDGVTVAKEIELDDPFENMGVQLVKEAASKTNDVAGDGTTTSTLLAYKLVEKGLIDIQSGHNPMKYRKGLLLATGKVVEALKSQAKEISSQDEVKNIAIISAQDILLGEVVAEAIAKIGKDGVITVEEDSGMDVSVNYREGMEFDKGFVSQYFITNAEKMEAVLDKVHLLITDHKISSLNDIASILELALQNKLNLMVIADEVEGEALATMVVNKMRGIVSVIAVKAPGFGDRRKEILADIASLTGATYLDSEMTKLESVTLTDLGQADRVIATGDSTIIVGGKGEKEKITERIKQIKNQIKNSNSEFDIEKLKERLARLTTGVATIKVGARTEVEMKEKKERVIDAVAATKAALEEGIVPGGCVALLKASKVLDQIKGNIFNLVLGANFFGLTF